MFLSVLTVKPSGMTVDVVRSIFTDADFTLNFQPDATLGAPSFFINRLSSTTHPPISALSPLQENSTLPDNCGLVSASSLASDATRARCSAAQILAFAKTKHTAATSSTIPRGKGLLKKIVSPRMSRTTEPAPLMRATVSPVSAMKNSLRSIVRELCSCGEVKYIIPGVSERIWRSAQKPRRLHKN